MSEKGRIEFDKDRAIKLLEEWCAEPVTEEGVRAWAELESRLNGDAERQGQIEQLQSLLETLESGDTEAAAEWIRAEIKMLERRRND